ncbi:MAG: MarR family transcriptional regulator [Eubacteriales bacterium]|nr:MarR family transcriptional regulator [Eubacteriales bacterium]
MTTDKVGKTIKCLNNLIMRNAGFARHCGSMDQGKTLELTPMQGWIMAYLYFHRDQVIYQKNLEAEFSIPKSTLATMLKQMAERGYIRRESGEYDTRLKRIYLSEEGEKIQKDFIRSFKSIDQYMCQGIPEEELEAFVATGLKMKSNLERNLTQIEDK